MTLLVWVTLVLAQVPAPASPAETEIERGRLLIRDLYEEKALEVLAPFLDDTSLPDPLRARALVYAGIAQMNLGDDAAAKTAFARALEVDIGAVLPEWVSRKVRVAFGAELERIMAANKPPAREVMTRAQRHSWVGPTLLGGVAVSAAFSVLGFVRAEQYWPLSAAAPDVDRTLSLHAEGVRWHTAGIVTAVIGGALLLAALLWWLVP